MGELKAFAARHKVHLSFCRLATSPAWPPGAWTVTRTRRSPWKCCVPTLAKRRSTLADYEVATVAVPPVDDRIVHQVPIADIRPSPHNPRHRLEGIDELAASIAEH